MPSINLVHVTLEAWGAIFMIVCSIIIGADIHREEKRSRILFMLLIMSCVMQISDALAWAFAGNVMPKGYFMVRICNFLVFLLVVLMCDAFAHYIYEMLDEYGVKNIGKLPVIIRSITFLQILLIVGNIFFKYYYYFDDHNLYYEAPLCWVANVIPVLVLVLVGTLVIRSRKLFSRTEILTLMAFVVLSISAAAVHTVLRDLSIGVIAVSVAMMLLFVAHQGEKSKRLVQKEKQLLEKEQELSEKKTQIMLSQIQPHFLFNCLSSISQLCKKDPYMAAKATDRFADYLRTNLNALRSSTLIPFADELRHIYSYLWLEKMRFGDELNIEYDIVSTSFMIPSLSVQPLVENAVKHGVFNNEDGGTVRIVTRRRGKMIQIQVIDDGVGFDPEVIKNDGRAHVGIENTRERIEKMCDGKLIIESTPGKGTTATILMPRRDPE